jgi:curli biogenesis system outer membrane secretion channel CsgG
MNDLRIKLLIGVASTLAMIAGCATEQSKVIQTQKVAAAATPFAGKRVPVSIGKFENRSNFMRGIFTDSTDRIGNQSKTILISHLNQSNRFGVLDRENMTEANQEAKIKNQTQQTKGADYLITGDITEFGRKEIGDHQLFGILGRGKEQIAYAKVTINVIDANTSEVISSAQGAGEYSLSSREIIGFGGTSGYDATLNGKVLDLAIREAVDKLSTAVDVGVFGKSNGR